MDLDRFRSTASSRFSQNRKFLEGLKRKPAARLDELFQEHHTAVFSAIDCLQCANCCRTTSPIFNQRDIARISRGLKLRPGEFIEKYLRIDDEGDCVLKSSPCSFLGSDNTCRIYADRPKACREYPHTNRNNMAGILQLTLRNTQVCPAVLDILDRTRNALE